MFKLAWIVLAQRQPGTVWWDVMPKPILLHKTSHMPSACQTFHRRKCRDLTRTHCGTPKTKRSLWQCWHDCNRLTVCGNRNAIYADSILGKGGGQEGQYPEWFKGKKDSCTSNTMKMAAETPIVWTYSSARQLDTWIADSAATVHVSSNWDNFSLYHKYDESRDIKAFRNNIVKGIGEGDILANVEF